MPTKHGSKPAVGKQDADATKDAINFFSNMFGIRHLENYVGGITFFENLALVSEPTSDDRPPAVAASNSLGNKSKVADGSHGEVSTSRSLELIQICQMCSALLSDMREAL